MGGGGGGGGKSAPETPKVQPTPKAEVTKNATEAATSARQAQKDKASRAAGLRGSILTSDLSGDAGGAQTTTKLGGGE